jgi:hypothetical protein
VTWHPARRGDLVVAWSDQGYEIGVVSRVREGQAEAWRTPDGVARPAAFVPGLRSRLIVPREQVDAEGALAAAHGLPRPFTRLADARAAVRPWLTCLAGTRGDREAAE